MWIASVVALIFVAVFFWYVIFLANKEKHKTKEQCQTFCCFSRHEENSPFCHRCNDELDKFRPAFTLLELLVVLSIIGVLLALLLPAVQKVREGANRVQCMNNIVQVVKATHNYESVNGCFFPGGNTCNAIGGMYNLAPYLERLDIAHSGFGVGAYNAPPIMVCPNRSKGNLDYAFFAGTWDGKSYVSCAQWGPGPGTAIRNDRTVKIMQLMYGSSNTPLYGEKRVNIATLGQNQPQNDQGWFVTWDWDWVRHFNDYPAFDWSDSSPRWYQNDLHGYEGHTFGSSHTAGWNLSYADGSVRFISYGSKLSTLWMGADPRD